MTIMCNVIHKYYYRGVVPYDNNIVITYFITLLCVLMLHTHTPTNAFPTPPHGPNAGV